MGPPWPPRCRDSVAPKILTQNSDPDHSLGKGSGSIVTSFTDFGELFDFTDFRSRFSKLSDFTTIRISRPGARKNKTLYDCTNQIQNLPPCAQFNKLSRPCVQKIFKPCDFFSFIIFFRFSDFGGRRWDQKATPIRSENGT